LVSTPQEGMAEALFDLASALQGDRQLDLALVYARLATRLKPDFSGAVVLIGDLLERQGRLKDANEAYQLVSSDPIYGWAARLRIAGDLDALGDSDRAAVLLSQMSRERPERIDALVRLGDLYRAKNRYAEAVVAYDGAIQRLGPKPQNFEWGIFYSRGVALERTGQWQRAEADFLKALELSPDQPMVLNYLGYGWADQGVHLDRALGMISRAVELRPQDGYIVDSKGWVLFRLGDYSGAVGQLERAVELRPMDPVINDHLGDAYWRVGRRSEARFQWQRALSLEPEAQLTTALRAKLERGLQQNATPGG
jgi:Flp pilus assembly protein TadD